MKGKFSCCFPSIHPVYSVFVLVVMICSSKQVSAITFLDYYHGVVQAEEMITNSRYKDAIEQYDRTFSLVPFNNPVDCYVAAQVAAYTCDTLHCIAFIRRGLSFGLPLSFVVCNPHLKSYIRQNGSLSRSIIDSCLAIYHSGINTEARSRIIALIQKDQAIIRRAGNLYESDGHTLKAIYRPVWDSMLDEVIALIKSSGFPAQKVAGTQNGDDGLFAESPHTTFAYFILIHHGNAWPMIGDLLAEELKKGNITPQMYGAIADYSAGLPDESSMRYFALRPCSTRKCKKQLGKRSAVINEARAAIGLCSYEVMERKWTSTLAYRKWLMTANPASRPVFDFQPDLHFKQ